ncbi:hypothetical protein, partial [Sphingomonas segetis]|uniref:hypothetical protein n=1 Tax=Sphingomonas segetis TaxID=1104779 RepID=UPI0012D35D44
MGRRVAKEMTVEEFDAWRKAQDKVEAVAQAADEVGGPRLSLVPLPDQNEAWPTDLLPLVPEADGGDAGTAGADQPLVAATPFDGIPLESSRNRLAGWSVERQRLFLTVLAETGQVHLAAAAARCLPDVRHLVDEEALPGQRLPGEILRPAARYGMEIDVAV